MKRVAFLLKHRPLNSKATMVANGYVCSARSMGVLEIDLNDGDKTKKSISDWLKENDLDAKLQVEGSMTEDSIEIGSVKLVE